ncbi:MAG: hypothetical protein U5P41_07140 [Gammaproteobacteria bacterium]|nr:hypothetical protein [Gammaproteobacteria bacterium]
MKAGLILGGVTLPAEANIGIRQTYELLGGRAQLRMASGTARLLNRWQKLRTRISGDGWTPRELAALDFGEPLLLACVAPRAVAASGNEFDIPAARRSDSGYGPLGWALVNGELTRTPLEMDGDTATLDAVAGASRYEVWYWPEDHGAGAARDPGKRRSRRRHVRLDAGCGGAMTRLCRAFLVARASCGSGLCPRLV